MAKIDLKNSLLLYIGEKWPEEGAIRWARYGKAGELLETGNGQPDEETLRAARKVNAIAQASAVLLESVEAPSKNVDKFLQALPNVIETRTCQEAEKLHVACNRPGKENIIQVAVVDRAWMEGVISALDSAGAALSSMTPETLLAPYTEGQWSVVVGKDDCFVRNGEHSGMALDSPVEGGPPVALEMLVQKARSQGNAPDVIHLYAGEGSGLDKEKWIETLGVNVEDAGPWDPFENGDFTSEGIELLQGRFAPKSSGLIASWGMTGAAAATALAVVMNVAAFAMEVRAMKEQERKLEADVRMSFRQVMGDVAMADPLWQMELYLRKIRARAGIEESGGLEGMLTLAAVPAGEESRLKRLDYNEGELSLTLVMDEGKAASGLNQRLASTGLTVRQKAPVMTSNGIETTFIIGQEK